MKKEMKYILTVTCLLLVLTVSLTGCKKTPKQSESSYLGTWNATTCEYDGFEMETEGVIDEFSITLQEDGQYTATIKGVSQTGQWEELEEGGVQLDKDEELIFTDTADGKLSLDYSEIIIYFEK